jgi:hypothetical protein
MLLVFNFNRNNEITYVQVMPNEQESTFIDSKIFGRGHMAEFYDMADLQNIEEVAEFYGVYPEDNGLAIDMKELYDSMSSSRLVRKYSNE